MFLLEILLLLSKFDFPDCQKWLDLWVLDSLKSVLPVIIWYFYQNAKI